VTSEQKKRLSHSPPRGEKSLDSVAKREWGVNITHSDGNMSLVYAPSADGAFNRNAQRWLFSKKTNTRL
jgi:hypothetical protein